MRSPASILYGVSRGAADSGALDRPCPRSHRVRVHNEEASLLFQNRVKWGLWFPVSPLAVP